MRSHYAISLQAQKTARERFELRAASELLTALRTMKVIREWRR